MSWEDIQAAAVGATIVETTGLAKGSDVVRFAFGDGRCLVFRYEPDCCASCYVADYEQHGDMEGEILSLERVTNADGPPPEYPDSYTWTFYHLRTTRGVLSMRWLGESNGYYSEEVTVTVTGGDDVQVAHCGAWE